MSNDHEYEFNVSLKRRYSGNSGVSLAVFMNSSGQDNVAQRYPNTKLVLDTDDDMPHNSNILDNPELTEQ